MHYPLAQSLRRLALVVAAVTLITSMPHLTAAAMNQTDADPDRLVYHQITDLGDDLIGVGSPEISADGSTVVFADAFGASDAEKPNRIFVVDADGSNLTEMDSYRPTCGCGALLAISEDGGVVLSSDSMQLRIADAGGARELLAVGSNEIGSVRLSADGQTAFFLVRRDTGTVDGSTLIPRGVWAIDADGGNLRQIVAAEDIANLLGITIEETGCCFYSDGMPFDISASGDEVVFGTFAPGGELVLGVAGDGDNLRELAGPFSWVKNVAISGDGSTVAFDIVPLDNGDHEVGLVDFTGGDPRILATASGSGFDDILHLSADGSSLLLTPSSHLVDTATGDRRQLAVLTPGAGGQDALLSDGMARASMNADATRFVYVMMSIRCADCINHHEQLATLDIGADPGAAPQFLEASLDLEALTIGSDEGATATAEVSIDGDLVSVGVVALRDGVYDPNLARNTVLVDDGTLGDERSNDDVFTNSALAYAPVVTRENGDDGPRTMRFQTEIIGSDGLRHAVAIDAAMLTVVAP